MHNTTRDIFQPDKIIIPNSKDITYILTSMLYALRFACSKILLNYLAFQSVDLSVKSIRKCKKSLYNQPKPYFFKKLL
jgi:hypothetical protein